MGLREQEQDLEGFEKMLATLKRSDPQDSYTTKLILQQLLEKIIERSAEHVAADRGG